MNKLEDKVALVTGAAVRIGREIALALARAGCDIAIHYRDSELEAESLADEIRETGRQAWLLQADLASPRASDELMSAAWEQAGWVDILVNNAAVFRRQPFAETELEEVESIMRVNALAPLMLARAMHALASQSPILPDNYAGRIINLLDRDIARPGSLRLPYWLSKKSLEAATLGLASELSPRFTVNAIAPGPVLSPDAPELKEPAGHLPLGIRPLPADIASAVLFLAESPAITGQTIYVDGGQHLSR
jgi:Dehydrogenases with different specificities (related to short-chain alcohol dehydrogenases)